MSLWAVLNWLHNRPVGVKLSLAVVGVVLFTALVLSFVLGQLSRGYFYEHARYYLERELQSLMMTLPGNGAPLEGQARALGEVLVHSPTALSLCPRNCLFALDGQGQTLLTTAESQWLPAPAILKDLAGQRQGWMRLQLHDEVGLLVYRTAPGGLCVGVVARAADLEGPTLSNMRRTTWVVTLLLAVLVAVLAVWLTRAELGRPLRRLAEEAERVADGDLTPPMPLVGREDEVGRLSRVLHGMTITARRMVAEAQANERRFQQLFVESRDATFIISDKGRIEDINPAGLAIFGYPNAETMRALPSTRLLFADQDERQRYLTTLRAQGYAQDYPATMLRSDGSAFEALITATLRGEGDGRFGLVRDVTQALKAQRALEESEERHRRLVENVPDIIYRWSIGQGSFEYISPAVTAITGYTPLEILHSTDIIWTITHPGWFRQVARQWVAVVRGRGPAVHDQEFKIITKSGQARWVRERSILVRDEAGQPAAVEGIATDITERKLVEQALERGRQMVAETLQGLPAAVMVVDRQHRVVHWNQAMEKLTRMPAAEMVGSARQWEPFYDQPRPVLADLIVEEDWEGIQKAYGHLNLKKSGLISGGVECEDNFPNLGGRPRHIYFLAAPIADEEGKVVRAVETLVDLSDKRRLEEELRRLTVTDDLTGLYNQRFFYATLAREMDSAHRFQLPLCLLMVDVDEFKSFNDRFGHLEGDKVLAVAARALRDQVRATDLTCRYGGEEFAVLLPRTGEEEARQVAERVRAGIAGLVFKLNGQGGQPQTCSITVSVGLAASGNGLAVDELVRRADQAMYQAKVQGRNRVAQFLAGGGIQII